MSNNGWKAAKRKYGVAVFSYNSAAVLHSMPLQMGETVQIWEEYWKDEQTVTWFRGCAFNNKNRKGIFPASYIATKDFTVENEGPFEIVTPVEDAIIKELTFVLREWYGRWKSLFVARNSLFQTIYLVMGELAKFRSTLVANTLTKEHAEELKHQVVTMIDWGNGQLGLDLVPRVAYQQADPDNVSVVEMYRIHEQSVKNCQGACVDEEPGGEGVKVKGRENRGEEIHHLQVGLCSLACNVGDTTEVLLSLYDGSEGKFLSEKYVMNYSKDGAKMGHDKNNSTIFSDFSTEDLQKELYLVLQILRKGRLTTEGSFKKVPNFHYRRPWGVSVLSLRDLLQIKPENELEYFLRVQCVENDSFYNMHEVLIKKQMQMTGKSAITDKQNQGVTLSVKILHGDLNTVKKENPILFSKGIVLTQRMGFPDFITPGEIRNDLYLTLHCAEFDRGSKTASKNVEVRIAVFNDKYEVIPDCILAANGEPMASNFFSYVLYHNNSPKWNETIRLSLHIEKFSTAHIRLELCHCSNRDRAEKKMYGFAYLSVMIKGNATRLDGKYDLCIYKCEDISKIKNYLSLPSLKEEFDATNIAIMPYVHSNKEYVTVETFLCSSKFAQKAELFNILQWALTPQKNIPKSLDSLVNLKGQELVRYLQDILDALFNMLTAKNGERVPYANNVFQALVHIFYLLHEDMFEKFSVVQEDYLEKHFSSTLAHKELMHCLLTCADSVYRCTDFDDKVTRKVFKVLEDIFKFSIKSCLLSQSMYGVQLVAEFRNSLNEVFKVFGKIVHSEEKDLHKTQAQLLNHLHKTYVPLLHIISVQDLTQLIGYIFSQINRDPGNAVMKAKTTLIKNTINTHQLMWDSKSRSMLLPQIVSHLKKCLIQQRNLELTAKTMGDLLTTIYKLKETHTVQIKDEVTKIIQGLFDVTVRTLWKLNNEQRKQAGCLLVACLTEMLRLMDDSHYEKLMGDYPKPKPLKDFLNRVLLVFRDLVKSNDFPADWITMRMVINNVMLTSIQYIAEDLTVNFLTGSDFDTELWGNFFLLAVDFITQPALQLEKYSEAKRSQIKDKYNDMRVPFGFHIYTLWNQLGSNKQHLMMDMIGPFLKVTMTPEEELRKTTIPIFFDVMLCEFQLKKHLRRVEGKMIHELDSLVIEHNGDVAFMKLFKSILLDKVQGEPELQEEGKRFVTSVTDLLEKLLDYREIMDREEQRDTKMHCTFNILNFYKDSRRDMYIRYITRLFDLHYSASNFVEAGLTLRLYANLLSWSQVMLPAEMSYPSQTEAERKEDLFNSIMNCFDKGKAWEYGIPLCKELAEHYEKTFQYKRLGQILQKQATFLYQILEGSKLRQHPTYYRIAYYGNTFPPYLRNKTFIYRGDECLKLATIMNQLMTEYPSATILPGNSPPDESYKQGDAQYIQICNVKPMPAERPEFLGKQVPSEISSFYATNEVDTFQFDRPYHRDNVNKNNEFKSLCLERYIMQSSYKLPGILRWYEVTSTRVVHFCPVQAALDTVQQMNAELKSSADKALSSPEQCLRHLEMRLQGVISGAVNGGIPKYQEAFFNEAYKAKYPDEVQYIDQLKSEIKEQIQLLEQGLAIHGKYASPEMQPLHKNLVDLFVKMKNSIGYESLPPSSKYRGSFISTGSTNQRPGTPSSNSNFSSGSNRSSVISGSDGNYVDDDNLYMDPPEVPSITSRRVHHSPSSRNSISNISDVHLYPTLPSYTDKRRCSTLRVASLTNLALKPGGSSRPLSAIVTSIHSWQYQLPNYDHSQSVANLTPAATDSTPPPSLPPRKGSITVPPPLSPHAATPPELQKKEHNRVSVLNSDLDRHHLPSNLRPPPTPPNTPALADIPETKPKPLLPRRPTMTTTVGPGSETPPKVTNNNTSISNLNNVPEVTSPPPLPPHDGPYRTPGRRPPLQGESPPPIPTSRPRVQSIRDPPTPFPTSPSAREQPPTRLPHPVETSSAATPPANRTAPPPIPTRKPSLSPS